MTQENNKKNGKYIGIIVGVIAFAISYFVVQQFFKSDLETELKNASMDLNKQTPINVDQYTRLDSSSTIGETNFIYYYTLTNLGNAEINIDTVNKYTRTGIIENVKVNPELKFFRDKNITLDYKYYDKNGDFTTKISVTPDLYK